MNEPLDRERLQHILEACREIQDFLDDVDRTNFNKSRILQRAVEKDLEIIGEAASNLSEPTKQKLSNIPWKEIIGMRNILIHVYFDVELDTIWKTVRNDIPKLREQIERVLEK